LTPALCRSLWQTWSTSCTVRTIRCVLLQCKLLLWHGLVTKLLKYYFPFSVCAAWETSGWAEGQKRWQVLVPVLNATHVWLNTPDAYMVIFECFSRCPTESKCHKAKSDRCMSTWVASLYALRVWMWSEGCPLAVKLRHSTRIASLNVSLVELSKAWTSYMRTPMMIKKQNTALVHCWKLDMRVAWPKEHQKRPQLPNLDG